MDVLFAVLPFADVNRPAIGVSLLHSAAIQAGFSSHIEYFNLDLAETIGLELYGTLAYLLAPDAMVGEWFFADLVFGSALPAEADFVAKVLARCVPTEDQRQRILDARRQRAQFIDDCVRRIAAQRPRVVGFTSTFHQSCACLAVAKRLKEGPAPPVTIFGGANCEGEMGLTMIRAFPWIDYISTGEADLSFPQFLERVLREGRAEPPPGILRRDDAQLTYPKMVENLDVLPVPNYADYYARVTDSPLRQDLEPVCLVEMSRGCWWGAKHHCTFCGLNGETMGFRSKSPDRAFAEVAALSRTYATKRVDCVDNILDMRYIQQLFPRLAAGGLDLEMFYEVKSNLRYDQLVLLRAGGVRAIQPGIENFSKNVLRLMKKGCSGTQNIQLLRWCRELDIHVAWNFLAGFPGEMPADYERQAELIPLLTHLTPPTACTPIRLDRFSPLYVNALSMGLARVRPTHAYYYAFPLGRSDLAKLAYYFEFDYADGRNPMEYLAPVMREVRRWTAARSPSGESAVRLDAECSEDGIDIIDTREIAVTERHRLEGLEAHIYARCDIAQTQASLKRHFGAWPEHQVQRAVERLVDARLMAEIDDEVLSLAVIRKRVALRDSEHERAA
jgi:ribosomal peptide maturation radical SAM protein 1